MGTAQKIQSYRDLEVWREAMKLAEVCYQATAAFPARETYGLASQIRRAAVSVASNIAEGTAVELFRHISTISRLPWVRSRSWKLRLSCPNG